MTNGEVWSLCLNDRTVKLEEMKKELKQLDIDYYKVKFEENDIKIIYRKFIIMKMRLAMNMVAM